MLLAAYCPPPAVLSAQQPQAQAGQATFPVNAKFVQGFGPGYWPTAGSTLTLNLAPGTAVCSSIIQTYAGGTLTLAPSATNYVYLNPANNCAPASNTTGFTSGSIPIATVVTTSAAISSITDVRTMFVSNGVTGSGTVTSVGMTGDGIIFSPTVSGSPITSSGTVVPQLLTQTANMVLAGPGSGLPATPTFRALASADLPATISSNTTGKAATATALASSPTQCGSNNWATGISTSGNATCLQPGFSNLAGSVSLGQTPLTTAGDLLFANSTPVLARLPIGGTNQFLGISGGLPAWIQPTFANLSGTASVSQGGTGQTTASAAFNTLSPLSTEGDVLYYHSSANTRLGVGSNGQCLTSNGTDPLWGSCSTGSMTNPMTTLGDLLYGGTSGTPTRLVGNTSTTPMYVKSLGASGVATAPTLAQIQFSDITGTLGIGAGGTGQTTASAAFNTLSPLSTEGDFLYYHSSANTRLGVGSNGQCLTSNGSDPAWGSCSGSSNLAWSTLINPTANLTLAMSTYTTTFNHTSAANWTWANTTAATSGTAQSSPLFNLSGTYWNGAASATDDWSLQDVVASGTNGNSTLTLAHAGSTGTTTLSVPNLTNTSTTQYGVMYGGGSSATEKSTAAGASGLPLLGQGSAAPAFGTLGIAGGGTGQTTANTGFNALSPLTTEGDVLYYHSSANTRLARGTNGQCLTSNGTDPVWGSCSTGTGTVTSVGLSMPSIFSVSGSPVTGSGTLTAALANQNAHLILAGPSSGGPNAPTFRALVGADLPTPSASTLGGIESISCTAGQFLDQVSTSGVPACATPSGSSSGLGNGSTVIDVSLQAGSDAEAKTFTAMQASSSSGAILDLRGFPCGQQVWGNTLTLDRPVTLLLNTCTSFVYSGTGAAITTSATTLNIWGSGVLAETGDLTTPWNIVCPYTTTACISVTGGGKHAFRDFTIFGSTSFIAQNAGIAIDAGDRATSIDDVAIDHLSIFGFYWPVRDSMPVNHSIAHNQIQSIYGDGIRVEGGTSVEIEGNYINGPRRNGVVLTNSYGPSEALEPTGTSATVSSGGSATVGNWTFHVTAVPSGGGETQASTLGSTAGVTTTSGNQTVTLTWTADGYEHNIYAMPGGLTQGPYPFKLITASPLPIGTNTYTLSATPTYGVEEPRRNTTGLGMSFGPNYIQVAHMAVDSSIGQSYQFINAAAISCDVCGTENDRLGVYAFDSSVSLDSPYNNDVTEGAFINQTDGNEGGYIYIKNNSANGFGAAGSYLARTIGAAQGWWDGNDSPGGFSGGLAGYWYGLIGLGYSQLPGFNASTAASGAYATLVNFGPGNAPSGCWYGYSFGNNDAMFQCNRPDGDPVVQIVANSSGSYLYADAIQNPGTTLFGVMYGSGSSPGGFEGSTTANTSTTPMYVKSVGTGSAATAPTLAQIQFSDIAGTLGIGAGGTGQTTANAAFNALSPLTTLGDLLYGGASGVATRLAGNSSATPMYLKSLGSGSAAAAPTLTQIQFSDIAGTLGIGAGGTGQTTANAAFNALSPLTTLGDLIYGAASGAATRLGGNTSSTKSFLVSTGSSGAATAPLWGSIATTDLPGSGAATVNGQTCTLNSTCSVNNGAAQYSLTVNGGAGAVLGGVSPSSTSGVPLISQGSSSNPVFGALNLAGGTSVVTGTLPAASFPALTGDTTNTAGSLATTTTGLHFGASNAVALPTSAPTSGGIPYFSSSSALASSAALTQYGVVVGGGAGAAPTSTAAGAANMPLIGQGAAAPIFATIAYPSSSCNQYMPVYAATTTSLACSGSVYTSNALLKSTTSGPYHSSILDNGTAVTTTEPFYGANGVALTSATTISATSMTTTGLVLPTVPVSTTVRGRCDIIWQQATAVSTVTFGVGMNNAPTDLYVTPIIWTSTSGANVSPSPTTITSTTTTAVTSTITPGASGTNYYGEFIFTLITGSSNTVAVTLYGDTQTTGDALVIEPGSSCGWLP